MVSHADLLEKLRLLVLRDGKTTTLSKQEVIQLATEYAQACEYVNARLQHCERYLDAGLRGEAIHAARSEPDVIELAEELNFPERDRYLELISDKPLPQPPPIALNTYQRLLTAIDQEQPIEEMLNVHRRLALASAPLNQRADVLRELADMDSSRTFWQEDLRRYETILGIPEAETNHVEAASIEHTAFSFREEEEELLENDTFTAEDEPAPEPEVDAALNTADDFEDELDQKRNIARQFVQELTSCQLANQIDRAHSLQRKWDKFLEDSQFPKDDPICQEVIPIFDWIRREDERKKKQAAYELAVDKLQRTLADPNATRDELMRRTEALRELDMEFPEGLEQKVQDRLVGMEQGKQALFLGLAVGVPLLLLLVLGIWVLTILFGGRSSIEPVLAQIRQHVAEQQWNEGQQKLEQLKSKGWDDLPEVQTLNQEIATGLATEAQRQTNFQQDLARLQQQPPLQVDLIELNALERQARTQQEKQRIEQFRTELQLSQRAAAQGELDALATESIQFLSKLGAVADWAELETTLSALQRRHRQLETVVKNLPAEAVRQWEQESTSLRQLALRFEEERTFQFQWAKLIQAAVQDQQLDSFINYYRELCRNKSANIPIITALQTAMPVEVDSWRSFTDFQTKFAAWQQVVIDNQAELGRRQLECNDWLKQYPQAPQTPLILAYREALMVIGERNTVLTQLQKTLNDDRLTKLHQAASRAGIVYLSEVPPNPPAKPEQSWLIHSTWDMRSTTTIPPGIEVALAPHCKVVQRLLQNLAQFQSQHPLPVSGWEEFLLGQMEQIRTNEELLPFWRFTLLQPYAYALQAGSFVPDTVWQAPLATLLQPKLDPIANGNPEARNKRWLEPDLSKNSGWLNYNNQSAIRSHEERTQAALQAWSNWDQATAIAAGELSYFLDQQIQQLEQLYQQDHLQLTDHFSEQVRLVGVVVQSEKNEEKLQVAWQAAEGQELWLLQMGNPTGVTGVRQQVGWRLLGKVTNGKLVTSPDAPKPEALPVGRPVLLRIKN